MSFSPEQSQFLTSREFSVTEIARWFNLPESMLENNARSTFSNIEHKSLWFLMNNLRPRARVYEQEYDWKLLGNDKRFYTSYNINAILRADATSRAAFYQTMIQNGIYNRDEVRALENKNAIPGGQGQEFLTPMNMTTDAQREEAVEGNGKAHKDELLAPAN
jgi:HK97 family phage portal protein